MKKEICCGKKSLGGSHYDKANAIIQSADGNFAIAGLTFSNDGDVSGNHTNGFGNTEDYWVVKLSSDVQSGIESSPADVISIFPNPAHEILTIDLPIADFNLEVSVFDVQGRKINLALKIEKSQVHLNTITLTPGFYTLQISDERTGIRELQKFVKQD